MKQMRKGEVPQYLRNSNLYLSLSDDDGSGFTVPPQFCHQLFPIKTRQDVEQLLQTLGYWMSNELPRELIDYAMSEDTIKFNDLFAKYERTLPELQILHELLNGDGSNVFMIIAKYGSVPMMNVFKERGERGLEHVCVSSEAIRTGHVECLEFAHEHGCPLPPDACAIAGNNGHVSCLQYAHEHGGVMDPQLCNGIARTGRLDCLKYAHKHGCELSANVMHTVTSLHFWDCMKYCHESGQSLDADTCVHATRGNRLDILMYAHQHGCELRGTAYVAMSVGHLDCFKYAYEQDPRLREVFAEVAAAAGHVECLQHLLKLHSAQSVPFSDHVCSSAARAGKLDCLACAHNAGCGWDEHTCEAAAANGHLECLKYAHENGCKWSTKTAQLAVSNSNLACWDYLYANGCPGALQAKYVPVLVDFWDSLTFTKIL